MILAAAYLRMSSDQQTASIAAQRAAVSQWAAQNGYRIVAWYVDEGISGWRDDRAEFQRLIADAPRAEWKAVLCWDQDRFSRFPPLEANHYWFLLDKAGVHLATVNQGRIDWSSLAGWLTASISQHGKSEYCRDLGKNIVRGQRDRKLKGQWIGKAPLGYTLGDDGFLKVGDPLEVELVRRIFKLRTDGKGTKYIATVLNRERIPTPRGKLWSSQSVRHILQRDAYLGHVVIGKWARGKYARVVEGRHVVENVHPALIDQQTWDAVRNQQQANHRKRHNGDGEGAPLAGLLFCGDCGAPMYSQRFRVYGTAHYLCRTYHSNGGCHCNRIDQEPILRLVVAKVREGLGLDDLSRVRESLAAKLAAKRHAPAIDKRAIERQIAALDTKLATAAERLVTVAPSLVPRIEAKMVDLQSQREALSASLAKIPAKERRRTVEDAMRPLSDLEAILRKGTPSQVRTALARVVEGVTIRFAPWKTTEDGRNWRKPTGGTLQLYQMRNDTWKELASLGKRVIRLSRNELAGCIRERAWNYGGVV